MSPRLALLIPMFGMACGGAADTPATAAPTFSAAVPTAAAALAPAPLADIAASDCQAVCDRINEQCGLDTWVDPASPLFCFMYCETGKDGHAEVAGRSACVAAAIDCAGVETCLADDQLHDAWMVIAAGSKDQVEGQSLLAAYRAAGGPSHGDYPMLVSSDTVEGLNPGFWIVVSAAPTDKTVAGGLRNHLRELNLAGLDTGGAYIKPVRLPFPEDIALSAILPPAWRTIIIWQTEYEVTEDWGFFTDDVQRAGQAVGIPTIWAGDDLVVPITVDGQTITTLDLTGKTPDPIGYVFAMAGRDPQVEPHSPSFTVIEHAATYFGVEMSLP